MTKTETYKDWIKDQMRKGIVNPEKVVAQFCRKFQIKDRAFYNHWKVAGDEYSIERQAIESKKAAIVSESAIKAVKRDIMEKDERMEILSKMAKGVARRVGDEIIIPTDGDRRGAIDLLNKMDGLYTDKSNLASGLTVTINADGITLKSDEI